MYFSGDWFIEWRDSPSLSQKKNHQLTKNNYWTVDWAWLRNCLAYFLTSDLIPDRQEISFQNSRHVWKLKQHKRWWRKEDGTCQSCSLQPGEMLQIHTNYTERKLHLCCRFGTLQSLLILVGIVTNGDDHTWLCSFDHTLHVFQACRLQMGCMEICKSYLVYTSV